MEIEIGWIAVSKDEIHRLVHTTCIGGHLNKPCFMCGNFEHLIYCEKKNNTLNPLNIKYFLDKEGNEKEWT